MIPLFLGLALAATPSPMLGGLPLKVAQTGCMAGMTDISPVTRAEIRLRQDSRIASIKIVPAGWRVTAKPGTVAASLATGVCATLVAEQIPASAEVTIIAGQPAKIVLMRRCDRPRSAE